MGIQRQHCYITNVVKRQISLSSKEDARVPVSKAELAHWESILRYEVAQLPNAKYFLLLGNFALSAMLNQNGITNWRGSVIEKDGKQFICAYNPAMVLRETKFAPIFKMDIHKLSRVMKGHHKPTPITPILHPSFKEACDFLDKMIDEKKPVAWDIETIANETACHGFANDVATGMCINLRDRDKNVYSLSEERILWSRLQRMLAHPDVKLVTQNGMFDSSWCWFKDAIRAKPIYFDTMLAHHTLYPQLPHGLGFITTQYTDHPYYKDEGKMWKEGGDIDTFWSYNVKDCCNTLAASQLMHQELVDQKLAHFFYEHVMRLQPHLIRMVCGGIKCDVELKDSIAKTLKIELDEMKENYYKLVQEVTHQPEYRPSPDSPKQSAKLFYIDLQLQGGRAGSTDATSRKYMRDHPTTSEEKRKILDIHDKYKEEKKFLGTYAEMGVDPDGRIRCEYKQTGVQKAPGRLSSASVWWGSGTNLQNQPQRAYPMFVADDGYEFNYFDLSGAEARIVMHLARIQKWIDDFAKKDADPTGTFDIHRSLAAEMFKKPYEEIPAFDRWEYGKNTDNKALDGKVTDRFIGKRCRHGLNYRMSVETLSATTGLPMDIASQAYQAYHRVNPEIRRWWNETLSEAKSTGELWSCFGRRLRILGRIDTDEAQESLIAFKPQSTIGDKVSSVIADSHLDSEWPSDARILLNIHDALIAINRIGDGERVRRVLKRHAEKPIIVNGTPVVIPAEMKVSQPDERGIHRWSTLKAVKL